MNENEIVDVNVEEIAPELRAEIEKKVKELKEANPKLKGIMPIVIDGDPAMGEKEHYVGYFSQPSFKAFSKYLSTAQKDSAVAMRNLATDCFIGGDKELVDDDSLFLFGLMNYFPQIIASRHGSLVKNLNTGK